MPEAEPRPDPVTESTLSRRVGGRRARVLWAIQVSVVLFGLWLLLSGAQAWLVGLAGSIGGGIVGAWLAPGDVHPWHPLRLLRFIGYFFKESLLGGLDVARRALAPTVDVAPCFARYRLGLPPGQPRTLMISVVSLLPGTLSVDLDADSGELLVHALSEDALGSVSELEQRVAWLFGLSLVPAKAERIDAGIAT